MTSFAYARGLAQDMERCWSAPVVSPMEDYDGESMVARTFDRAPRPKFHPYLRLNSQSFVAANTLADEQF
jgi:hypothetical protein